MALGAKMVPFGGWEMPLAYPSGTVAEHRACRSSAVAFDVSHLGTVRVGGPEAYEHLQRSFSNDLERVHPGRAQYTHLLDEDGFVVDDMIVWWVDEERFDVMPNASNTSDVLGAIGGTDVTEETGGHRRAGARGADALGQRVASGCRGAPLQRRALRMGRCDLPGGRHGLHGRGGRRVRHPRRGGGRLSGRRCWRRASSPPVSVRATRCASKQGCRCTGTSSAPGSPRSRRGWPGWWAGTRVHSPDAPPLEEERANGPARRLRGLVADGRQPLRDGADICHGEQKVGIMTSGNFSPMRECGIGLGFVEADAQLLDGDPVTVLQRGRELAASLLRPPLWPVRRRRGVATLDAAGAWSAGVAAL